MVRVITISREYGSGGAAAASALAERLGWRLVNESLLTEIARLARVDRSVAARYDECVSPWFHRLMRALWRGGFEGAVARVESDFDADTMAALCERVIREAADIGNCVTVGRGGQCILQNRPDAFHVSIYAPLEIKLPRLHKRHPGANDLESIAAEMDRRRADYIRRYFGQDWTNRHLYNLLVCSSIGIDAVVATILCAAGLRGQTATSAQEPHSDLTEPSRANK